MTQTLIQPDGFLAARRTSNLTLPVLSLTPPFPKGIVLELTTGCNHACSFCKNPTMTRPHKKMQIWFAEAMLRQGAQLGATELGLSTTGDPFMYPSLRVIVELAKQVYGYQYVYASTNGAMATPARLEPVLDAGLDSLKFSINAGSRKTYTDIHGHDEMALVLKHLAWTVRHKAKTGNPKYLGISYVKTTTNAQEVEAFIEHLSPFVDDVYVSPCGTQIGYKMENVGTLAAEPMPVDPPCHWLWNRVHITAEGYLTLCCVDYQNYLAIEDLNVVPLKDAWHSPRFQEMRRKHIENDLGATLCKQCLSGQPQTVEPLRKEYATAL